MGQYTNADPRLWPNGLVEIHIIAVVPELEAPSLVTELRAIL